MNYVHLLSIVNIFAMKNVQVKNTLKTTYYVFMMEGVRAGSNVETVLAEWVAKF